MDLPVKLAVCAVILGMMVPLVMDAVDTADDRLSGIELELEADRLAEAVQRTYMGGAGSVSTLDLRIPAGQWIEVGGENGYTLRMHSEKGLLGTVYLDSPAARILGPAETISGSVLLELECVNRDEGYGVEIRVIA